MAENILKKDFSEELAISFKEYADYVINDRALPHVYDGLKPVQRRILYAMDGLKLNSNGSFKKSARIVGETLGKYHAHGDISVYNAMVKLVQPFSTRYPLVLGQGNYGNQDNDPPAAMRYTEAKLSPIGELMLEDITKNTVEMVPNYDESEIEPLILPSLFPNLLANGTEGIAVGMASSFAPHNAKDLYKALDKIFENALEGNDTSEDEIINIIKAPDFPTGGTIMNPAEVKEAYKTGRGKVIIRSKYEIENIDNQEQIVITEIPYKTDKSKIHNQIFTLSKTKIPEIKEVRDESGQEGIRLVVELKKSCNNIQWVIKQLLKFTDLQYSYSINHVAVGTERPLENEDLSLKALLMYFIEHSFSVIRKKIQFDLSKMQARRHIVEGIFICLDHVDDVITVIKESESNETVNNLVKIFDLSEIQAEAIINIRLGRLSNSSAQNYRNEYDTLNADIMNYSEILSDEIKFLQYGKNIFKEISNRFEKDKRLTEIDTSQDNFIINERDLVKEEQLIISITTKGIIKAVKAEEYEIMGRRNKGTKATTLKEEESIKNMLNLNSKDDILFFTNKGRCHILPAFKIPISSKTAQGKYVNNFLNLEEEEFIINILSTNNKSEDDYLFFVTKKGLGKKLSITNLSKRMSVTRVISFKDEDELICVNFVKEKDDMFALSKNGKAIRFAVAPIRASGRTAFGVKIMSLKNKDEIATAIVYDQVSEDFLLITKTGYSKRCSFNNFTRLSRGRGGMKVCTISDKTGEIVSAVSITNNDDLFIATKNGKLSRISASAIRVMGRSASGVKTINLADDDYVVSISKDIGEEKNDETEQ